MPNHRDAAWAALTEAALEYAARNDYCPYCGQVVKRRKDGNLRQHRGSWPEDKVLCLGSGFMNEQSVRRLMELIRWVMQGNRSVNVQDSSDSMGVTAGNRDGEDS